MLRVSVLELPARWDAADAAFADVDALLGSGPATDLAILPEMSLGGYVSPDGDFDLSRFAEPLSGPTLARSASLARRHGTHLVVPLVLDEGGDLYNAAIVVDRKGELVATYRKRHPWFPEAWATPGPFPLPRFELDGLKVTVAICFDGHFVADDGAEALAASDLLVFTSAWVDEEDSRLPLLLGLSRRFGVSVANANWGTGDVVVPGQGGSCIIDGQARVLAAVPNARPSMRAVFRSGRADATVVPRPRRVSG